MLDSRESLNGGREHGLQPAPRRQPRLIRVQGARVYNLKDGVEIPKRRLTVFTGALGSGKSSLLFGTIAAESQRLINEIYRAFVLTHYTAPTPIRVEQRLWRQCLRR